MTIDLSKMNGCLFSCNISIIRASISYNVYIIIRSFIGLNVYFFFINIISLNISNVLVTVIYNMNLRVLFADVCRINFINTILWTNILSKFMLFFCTHCIPFFLSISVVDTSMPMKHSARSHFCTCFSESL